MSNMDVDVLSARRLLRNVDKSRLGPTSYVISLVWKNILISIPASAATAITSVGAKSVVASTLFVARSVAIELLQRRRSEYNMKYQRSLHQKKSSDSEDW